MRILLVVVIMALLSACGQAKNESYQVINKDPDGKISILNQTTGRLVVINKSNRVDDVVDLNLNDGDVEKIKAQKELQDAATKIKLWGESDLTGTKYKVDLSTRYYKDKLLYSLSLSPYDAAAMTKAYTVSIDLRDTNSFVLEKFVPPVWSTMVDDKGKPVNVNASGEMPMTLDNYLEISSYSPRWGR